MLTIRPSLPSDDDAVATLLVRSFEHLYAARGMAMSPERRSYLSDQAGRRGISICFVGEIDGKAIGTVTLVPPSDRCEAWVEGAWDLRLLAVDPDVQQQGVATALVDHAEAHARAAGARVLCLHARRGMAHQARFYPARGYTRDPAGDLDVEPYQEGYLKELAPAAAG